jgi:hypothetical protein
MARQALPLICVVAVLAIGWLGIDAGYINGDAAVYAHQGAQWDLGQRWVHLGWIALAAVLSPAAQSHLPAWMDAVHVLAAASVPWSLSRLARPKLAGITAVVGVIAALPWASGAEVDVPTVALMLGAASARSWLAVVLAACALSFSPGALLMLPSVMAVRWFAGKAWWPPMLGVVVGVVALSAVSGGAWWWGDRGVLTDPSIHVGRAARAAMWGLLPAAVVVAVTADPRRWRLPGWRATVLVVSVAPLLTAPTDSQLWLAMLVVSPTIILWCTPSSLTIHAGPLTRLAPYAAGLALSLSVAQWGLSTRHRADEAEMIGQVAADLGPDDGVIAPWTLGVRISLAATGDPYALLWRKPNGFVRDQEARWTPPPRRVVTVP